MLKVRQCVYIFWDMLYIFTEVVFNCFSSTSTICLILLVLASEKRHEMSTRTSTVYKYVTEHYPISKEHYGAREHQVDNP
jgi:hypothetical protein